MVEILILKVESPSCLWGRVVRGPGGDPETTDQYDRLLAQMNLFYHDVTQDLRKLKPTSLEEGQMCVVYWSMTKSWCRALVESIIMDSVSFQARCLLVDHGERLVVPSDQIRVAMPTFLQLPFWVRRFHLAGIKPTTLRVSVYEGRTGLIPSTQWDSSATLYLYNLLQASTRTEAVLLESEPDSTSVELYLTVGNIKICVNDDLVVKKFAYYSRKSADGSEPVEVDQFPVMLSSSILNRTVCTTPKRPSAQTQPPAAVSSSSDSSVGSADWLTASSTPQSPQPELKTSEDGSRSKVTGERLSAGVQAEMSCEAAAESDSSEDTDSSLAAALTRNLSLFRFLKFLNPGSSSQQLAPTVSRHEELRDCETEDATAASSTEQEVKCGAEGHCESSQVESLADEETSSLSRSVASPAEKTWRKEEDRVCSRLLEWLNPDPVNADPDAADETVAPSDPSGSGILVHSALPVEPCSSLDDAPVTDALRWVNKNLL